MKAKLNEAQIAALIEDLSNNPGDTVPDSCEIEVVEGVLMVNGAYLHSDGKFASFPED
jgi:hypothetical protein